MKVVGVTFQSNEIDSTFIWILTTYAVHQQDFVWSPTELQYTVKLEWFNVQ